MNGYEKMKRIRRLKVTKIVSSVTALSMAVTGMAVAASANSASPDYIAEALGGLTQYGIVAENMYNAVDFESNFAVKDLEINTHFSVSNAVNNAKRFINFSVGSDGEGVYFYGIYDEAGDMIVDPIAVSFDEAGTKEFTVTVPDENKYDVLTVHELNAITSLDLDGSAQLVVADEGVKLTPAYGSDKEHGESFGSCIIAGSMTARGETFGADKNIYVSSEIWSYLNQENDGRWSFNGNIIANNSNSFYEKDDAEETVDELIDQISAASDKLARVNSAGDKVLYLAMSCDSVYAGETSAQLREFYSFVKDNPDYMLLVNVNLKSGSFDKPVYLNLSVNGGIDTWDAEASSRIVFNFIGGDPEYSTIALGEGFRGTVVAPNARVTVNSTICGAIYAPECNIISGELHMAPYYAAMSNSYSAVHEVPVEETTSEETTPEEETTTEEATTTEEFTTTIAEEVTTTTEEVTTTTTEEATTTTTEEVTTTTTEEATTTTTEEVTTTTTEEATTTTAEEVTTTTTEEATTTTEEVTTTTTEEATTTTTEEVTTTTAEEITTTTTEEITTTTTEEATTAPEETDTEEVTTTTTEEADITSEIVTTPPETSPEETTAPETVTSTVIVTIPIDDEGVPRLGLDIGDEDVPLIIIDDDVPRADAPPSTGVTSNVGIFATIGGAALLIGAGAQVYTVITKKKK